jgi:hypothetical protein
VKGAVVDRSGRLRAGQYKRGRAEHNVVADACNAGVRNETMIRAMMGKRGSEVKADAPFIFPAGPLVTCRCRVEGRVPHGVMCMAGGGRQSRKVSE